VISLSRNPAPNYEEAIYGPPISDVEDMEDEKKDREEGE
jgi:hypothetical protein